MEGEMKAGIEDQMVKQQQGRLRLFLESDLTKPRSQRRSTKPLTLRWLLPMVGPSSLNEL